jgi:acyl carrier protein
MVEDLNIRLKHLIIETLNLEDVTVEDIPDDEPLFGAGLDLDSIDALELVLKLEKEFGVKIGNSEESRKALASVQVLASYIQKNGKIAD